MIFHLYFAIINLLSVVVVSVVVVVVIIEDLVYAYKVGVKTLYYANSPDGDVDATSGCEGGGCSI